MTFAAKVALITRGTTEIVKATVRLVTSLGVCVGLLYGVSEEPESKVHGRLLWPWNKGAANVSRPNEGRRPKRYMVERIVDRDWEEAPALSGFGGLKEAAGEADEL